MKTRIEKEKKVFACYGQFAICCFLQVGIPGDRNFSDSFVYESIPRNDNGKIMAPGDHSNSNTFNGDDGISVEPSQNVSMAWTQFQHAVNVEVEQFPQ